MPLIELIYDSECPNVEEARRHLRRACQQAGVTAQWQEWERAAPESPVHARRHGSPTILVDEQDVVPMTSAEAGNCCRVYPDKGGYRRAPSVEEILVMLRRSGSGRGPVQGAGRGGGAAMLPGVVVAALPNLACPACWPGYASLMSSIGLGFVVDSRYLLALTIVFLAVGVAGLAYGARGRRGYGPLWLGLGAAVTVVVGKFAWESRVVLVAGIALLVAASLWNAWQRSGARAACPDCRE